MSANNKDLRLMLEEKTVEELESILALDFARNSEADADFIRLVLEVIEQKEGASNTSVDLAWDELQSRYQMMNESDLLEAEQPMNTPHDHGCNPTVSSFTNKIIYLFRNVTIAAVLIMLLCFTVMGTNFYQLVADWAEDTFSFLSNSDERPANADSPTDHLRSVVQSFTKTPVVPVWMPEGAEQSGNLRMIERNDRTIIGAGYLINEREVSIQIVVYHDAIEVSPDYQKNKPVGYEYQVSGITHYFSENVDNWCVVWTHNNVECSIQGQLTEQELQQMIDSIYQKE